MPEFGPTGTVALWYSRGSAGIVHKLLVFDDGRPLPPGLVRLETGLVVQ